MSLNLFYVKRALGRNGKPLAVPKIRTMYQRADDDLNSALSAGLDEHGKLMNDLRITPIGKSLRKWWVDEIPQLLTVLWGDMKLIGIRPRREIDWQQFPESHKEEALRDRPGLIPAAYAGPNRNFDEFIEAEREYLRKRKLNPTLIDREYFKAVLYNIFFHGLRGR